MLCPLINLFGEMFHKFIHLIASMLHDIFRDVGGLFICFFKFMVCQAADFFGFFLRYANNFLIAPHRLAIFANARQIPWPMDLRWCREG